MVKEEIMVRKIVKRYGNTLVIQIDKEDAILYNINKGNSINVDFGSVERKKKNDI